jgi:hypothetical protein
MQATTLVENCYAGMVLTVSVPNLGNIHVGGVAGAIDDVGSVAASKIMIDNVTIAGTLNVNATNTSGNNSINMGGIAGRSGGRGTIQNSVVTGQIIATATNTTSYIGGLFGFLGSGHVINCHFMAPGQITTPNSPYLTTNGQTTHIGGIAGHVNTTLASTIRDSSASGNIIVTNNGNGWTVIGGAVAFADSTNSTGIQFINCEYYGGRLEFNTSSGTRTFQMGGFIGTTERNVYFDNCRSRASGEGVKVEYSGSAINGASHAIGGFAGFLRGGVTGCYSTSNVTVVAGGNPTGTWSVGGFAGYHEDSNINRPAIGYWMVNRSYATGSVTVTANAASNYNLEVGGFIGTVAGTRIVDCYAKGNVTVNRTAGTGATQAHVGGLIGAINGGVLERCISTGNVSSINTTTNTTGINNVGGVIGNSSGGARIENNVYVGNPGNSSSPGIVLWQRQTLNGESRLIGNGAGTGVVADGFVNNYASSMAIQRNRLNDGRSWDNTGNVGERSSTGRNGASVSRADLGSSAWWLITARYNGTDAWDYSRVHADFHPRLIGVGGQ